MKNLELLTIWTCSVVKLRFDTKILSYKYDFLSSSKSFSLKNTSKLTLQYLFNVYIVFNTNSYIRLELKLKIDQQMCTFKNLEEI